MSKSACFTGHRSIEKHKEVLKSVLASVLEQLITQREITEFYAGGAYGFDALASLTVLKLKEQYPQVKLHLMLPCSNEEQTEGWTDEQKAEYHHILELAECVEYVSEHKTKTCMKERNARLVDSASECCVCYWNMNDRRSGTGQTVRMAQKKGIEVINLFETAVNSDNSAYIGLTDTKKKDIINISYDLEVTTMPRKKKTETAPVAEVKAEGVPEAVKETVVAAPAPVVEEKAAKKPVAKKTPAKKTAPKATTKNTKAATAPKETVKVQFGGDEYDFAEIKKAVETDYKSKVKGKIKTVEIYIKPEDKAVYYVINSDFSDKIDL